MSPIQRELLAREMAKRVVHASRPMEVWVVSESRAVQRWAEEMGCRFVPGPDDDLDAAVELGLRAVELAGFKRAVVVHGDLPYARTLLHVACVEDIVVVTDSKGQGTNILSTPVPPPLSPSYGEGSLQRHAAMVRAAGVKLHVIYDPALSRDIDEPEDLMCMPTIRLPAE
jgi:2-phospho-L-lactate guanylyltransferase